MIDPQDMTRKYGALNQEVIGSHTDAEWSALVREWKWRCFYCAKPICKNSLTPDAELTKDHMLPISRGGSDFIWNIVPACFACNTLKGTLTVDEFRSHRPGAQKHGCVKEINIPTGEDTAGGAEDFHKQENSETVENPGQQTTDIRALLVQWTQHCAKLSSMNDGYPKAHDTTWYEQRRTMLKKQAAGMKRMTLEAAGQQVLAMFGDEEPRKLMNTEPESLVVSKGIHLTEPRRA